MEKTYNKNYITKMTKKYSVTVGISALNEQNSIVKVINSVLKQKQADFWQLKELLVFSDGSTDKTVELVRSNFKSPVVLYDFPKREGKPVRTEQMFQKAKGDLFVMLDADITILDSHFLTKLLKPLIQDDKAMMVGGFAQPKAPATFLQRAVYSTYEVFYEMKRQIRGGHNMFGMSGRCLAFKSEFSKQIHIPSVICEDDYLYFLCLYKGYKFLHTEQAVVYHKLPKTLKDYLKQSFRCSPEAVVLNYKEMFGELVDRELARPLVPYIKSILKVFYKNPLEVSAIVLINLFSKPLYPFVLKSYNMNMYTASSTK